MTDRVISFGGGGLTMKIKDFVWTNKDFSFGKLKVVPKDFSKGGFTKICEFDLALIKRLIGRRKFPGNIGVYYNDKTGGYIIHNKGYVIAHWKSENPSLAEGTINKLKGKPLITFKK